MNGLIITEVIALTCKTYGFNYQTPGEFNRVQIKNKRYFEDSGECITLSPKEFKTYYKTQDEYDTLQVKHKKALKGISKAVVKNEITIDNYVDTLEKNKNVNRDVTSIRSFNHQLFTYTQNKIALTPHYDKMKLLDPINTEPFGYNPL